MNKISKILTTALFLSLSLPSSIANADNLVVGGVESQEQENMIVVDPLKQQKEEIIDLYNKIIRLYSKDVKRSDLKKARNIAKLSSYFSNTREVKRAINDLRKTYNIGKSTHKMKTRYVKKVKSFYLEYRHNISKEQRDLFKSLINRIKGSRTKEKLKLLMNNQYPLLKERANMSKHIDATGWSRNKLKYVKNWATRNNRYLRGTKMSGLGYLISNSAYNYNMDPRLCAAIARIESGCGSVPYGCKYNVWGWVCGAPSMHSWGDAINKWHSYFSRWFRGDKYPINSMYGYGGYDASYTNSVMAKI